MKIFLSWSGDRSHRVAELLGDWLSCVVQAAQPWISSRDLDRGSLWFGEIGDQLKDTSVGVICLTRENKRRPWILFEAGALAKGLATARVCTLLVDLPPTDVEDPLAQFNHTIPNQTGIFALVRTLNAALGDRGLSARTLQQVFDTYWPQFEEKFSSILRETIDAPEEEKRPADDLLAEILSNTRNIHARVRKLEEERPSESFLELVRQREDKVNLLQNFLEDYNTQVLTKDEATGGLGWEKASGVTRIVRRRQADP